jgi:hypothetical protein
VSTEPDLLHVDPFRHRVRHAVVGDTNAHPSQYPPRLFVRDRGDDEERVLDLRTRRLRARDLELRLE